MPTIEIAYTQANRILRPLVPTLYVLFLGATLLVTRGEANRWFGMLSFLLIILTAIALRTWWQAWTFRLCADEDGITQIGGLSKRSVAWNEITALDARREGEFRSDEERQDRPLSSIALIGADGILMDWGHDLRCVAPNEREALLKFIEAHLNIEDAETS